MMDHIFSIKTLAEFEAHALKIFQYQVQNVPIYKQYISLLHINPNEVSSLVEIPFLPISMWKNYVVSAYGKESALFFQSSGTGNIESRSRHYIQDIYWYTQSLEYAYRQFVGNPEDQIILGLLPNYQENPHSSLIFMTDYLMKKSRHHNTGYFLNNFEELASILTQPQEQDIILFGVSFALLDFAAYCEEENIAFSARNTIKIIETGGMKGRKKEITKLEMLKVLQHAFPGTTILSEYSMTELFSQAYTIGDMTYYSPSWMRILVRELDDPFSFVKDERQGGINIIDLANYHTCSFIATEDLGKINALENQKYLHPGFEVLGRIDHSEIRGCSQLVV